MLCVCDVWVGRNECWLSKKFVKEGDGEVRMCMVGQGETFFHPVRYDWPTLGVIDTRTSLGCSLLT